MKRAALRLPGLSGRWFSLVAVAVLGLPVPTDAVAQTVSGQIRPRFEFRDPSADGGMDDFMSMRTRLTVNWSPGDLVSGLIQFQDVRIFGEEMHPLFDDRADGIDLHQAYLQVKGRSLPWLTSRVGRMEASFGGERLIGPVGWTQQGQSFDGVRLDVSAGSTTWALIGYALKDETAPGIDQDQDLFGVYGTIAELGGGALDLYWLYDRVNGAVESDEHVVGARFVYEGAVDARFEGSRESGTRAGTDVDAYMWGARLGRAMAGGEVRITLWYDHLSGDDPSTPSTEVFRTFYGTNHKFYGLADLFLDIPAHTGGAGLKDLALKLLWRASPSVSAAADLHTFRAARAGSLSGAHLGDELDVSVSHRYGSGLTATAGFSYVLQDDPFSEIGRLDENLTWFYVMLNATF